MQLNKADDIITRLKELDIDNFPLGLQCWVKNEGKYNIYIFSVLVENEVQLKEVQANVRDYIAIYFQGQILEKEVERWNIYQIFICSEKIQDQGIKLSIEQDKFATRKLVVDGINAIGISDEVISKKIYNEIFKFEFKPTEKELTPLSESLSQADLDIIKLASSIDLGDEDALLTFANTICHE